MNKWLVHGLKSTGGMFITDGQALRHMFTSPGIEKLVGIIGG